MKRNQNNSVTPKKWDIEATSSCVIKIKENIPEVWSAIVNHDLGIKKLSDENFELNALLLMKFINSLDLADNRVDYSSLFGSIRRSITYAPQSR